MSDDYRIDSMKDVRSILGEPSELTPLKVFPTLDETTRRFVELSPFLVLSTADRSGNQDVSPKGDPPGFVWIENDRTIVIPDRAGNRLVLGHQNILENPHVGVLFFVPGTPETLRVSGKAELTCDPRLLNQLTVRGKPAPLAIRVSIDEVFYHCPKAFLRSELWNPESWPEQQRISMGKVLARRLGKDQDFAAEVDARIGRSRREL